MAENGSKSVILQARQGDDGSDMRADILQSIVDDFELNLQSIQSDDKEMKQDNAGQVDSFQQTLIDYPEEDLVFQLIKSPDETKQEQVEFQALGESTVKQVNKEGEAIMAGLTGFGAANLGHNQHPSNTGSHHTPSHIPSTARWQHDKMPYVKILEQPAENKLRFRYECEGRSAGALHGVNHTNDHKTFPTIQVVGYKGPAVVVVSCIEDKPPYRTHPHNLVGRDGMCKKGVCSVDFNNPEMVLSFQNIGIQCVKRRDAPASLARREQIQVDPFKQGFRHKNTSINLNSIRLCFQVFLKTDDGLFPLAPVVSNVIRDKKSYSDLQIVEYSDDFSPVKGGRKILMFCEKVYKDDIEVRFSFNTQSGEPVILKGEFTVADVHKQHGISFRTPAYPNPNITSPAKVSMYLYKPSDKSASEPVDFWFVPNRKDGFRDTENTSHRAPQAPRNNKRERVRPDNRGNDDPSSGMINVPPKITPEQLRGAGGQVVVVNEGFHQPVVPQPPLFNSQGYPDMTGGSLFTDMVTSAAAAATTEMHQSNQNVMHHPVDMGNQSLPINNQQPIKTEPDKQPLNNLTSPFLNSSEFISAGISLTNIDVNTNDLENLSSNLGLTLKLERDSSRHSSKQNISPENGKAKTPADKMGEKSDRMSTQLETPDVSSNLDGEGHKKNNLNK